MRSFLKDEDVLYIDLSGKHASEIPSSTVPVSIQTTSARPDMFLVRNMLLTLIELTISYDSRENLRNARARKSQKSSYLELLGDLEAKVYSASLVTCEISSLGHSLAICLKAIHELFSILVPPSVPCLTLWKKLLYQPLSRYIHGSQSL